MNTKIDELLRQYGRWDVIGYETVAKPQSGIKLRINLSSYCPSGFRYPLAGRVARKYGITLEQYNANNGTNNQPCSIPIFSVTCYDEGRLDAELKKIIEAAEDLQCRCETIAKLEKKLD